LRKAENATQKMSKEALFIGEEGLMLRRTRRTLRRPLNYLIRL